MRTWGDMWVSTLHDQNFYRISFIVFTVFVCSSFRPNLTVRELVSKQKCFRLASLSQVAAPINHSKRRDLFIRTQRSTKAPKHVSTNYFSAMRSQWIRFFAFVCSTFFVFDHSRVVTDCITIFYCRSMRIAWRCFEHFGCLRESVTFQSIVFEEISDDLDCCVASSFFVGVAITLRGR